MSALPACRNSVPQIQRPDGTAIGTSEGWGRGIEKNTHTHTRNEWGGRGNALGCGKQTAKEQKGRQRTRARRNTGAA